MHESSDAEGADEEIGPPVWSTPRLMRLTAQDTIANTPGVFSDSGGRPSNMS